MILQTELLKENNMTMALVDQVDQEEEAEAHIDPRHKLVAGLLIEPEPV